MTSLWILNHYACTPEMPGGSRHFELGRELTQLGFEVTILASSYRHHSTQHTNLEPGQDLRVEDVQGIRFVWLRTFPYRANDWRRVVNMISYMVRAYWLGRRLPALDERIPAPDIVLGSSVHLLAVVAAYYLARHFESHFVMEVRDLWPQTLVDIGALGDRHPLVWLLRRLERFLYRRAERIIVLLPGACDYIANLGIEPDKVHWVPNGVSLSDWPVAERSPFGDSKFTVMYAGAHGRANGLQVLLEAAQAVQKRGFLDIRFVLVGNGPEKPALIAYRDQLGLANTEFREAVPKERIPLILQEADILALVLLDLALYKYGVSLNKLFDYLAASRPLVLAGKPANNVVEEAQCGLCVPPSESEALAEAIICLYQMPPEERISMGRRGRRYVEQHHDFAVLARRLASILEALDGREPETVSCEAVP